MLYYVTRGSPDNFMIGSYMVESTAKQYNPSATIVADVIMTQELGFPLEDRVVRAYSRNARGTFALPIRTSTSREYEIYARDEFGDWALVSTADSFSFSKIPTGFAETIMVEASKILQLDPRETIGKLTPGQVSEREPRSFALQLSDRPPIGNIYDD